MTQLLKKRPEIGLESTALEMLAAHTESESQFDEKPKQRLWSNRTNASRILRRPSLLLILLAILVAPNVRSESLIVSNPKTAPGYSPQRELIYEGMTSFGSYEPFGVARNVKLNSAGVEYDRELRARLFHARLDYVTEVLPVLILTQSAQTDSWGNSIGTAQKTVPGAGVTPLGFRLLWRDGSRIMPYFDTKASVLAFTQKVLSTESTYENWSFHSTGGVKLKLGGRYDLRLGMLSEMHFSNGNIAPSNPGADFMNVNVGIVYHLGERRQAR